MLDTEDDDHPVTMPFRDYSRRKRITFVVALVLLISLIVGVALVVHYVVVGSQSSSTVPPSLVTGGSSTDGAGPTTTTTTTTTTNPVPTTTHSAPMQVPSPIPITPVAIPGGSPITPVSLPPGGSLFDVLHDTVISDQVDQVIRSVALGGGSEFNDLYSYQSMALRWLQTDAAAASETSMSAVPSSHVSRWSQERLIQRYALACIYYATNAVSHMYTDMEFGTGVVEAWVNDTHWLTTQSECEWFGIICDDATMTTTTTESNDTTTVVDVVTALHLYQNGLTGSFPGEVALLYDIIEIDLYNNSLWNVGDEGHAWMNDMTSLEYLYYSNNYFEYDGIPTQLSQLVNLREYDCSYNLYVGPLWGESFVDLTELEYVVLSGNDYNSSVPIELTTLPNLERLYIEDSSLTGSLDFLPSMTSIVELWMDFNFIEGSIPTEIGTLSTLASLSLSNNLLTGSVPKEMASMTQMDQLWLYNNTFNGRLPSEFGFLTAMRILYLDGSQISGHIPSQVCALRNTGSLETLVTDCVQDLLACACCTECA